MKNWENISHIVTATTYNIKSYFPKNTENIIFEMLLPNSKPIIY